MRFMVWRGIKCSDPEVWPQESWQCRGGLIRGHGMKAEKGEGLAWLSSQCSPLPQQVTDSTFRAIKIHVCQSMAGARSRNPITLLIAE